MVSTESRESQKLSSSSATISLTTGDDLFLTYFYIYPCRNILDRNRRRFYQPLCCLYHLSHCNLSQILVRMTLTHMLTEVLWGFLELDVVTENAWKTTIFRWFRNWGHSFSVFHHLQRPGPWPLKLLATIISASVRKFGSRIVLLCT